MFTPIQNTMAYVDGARSYHQGRLFMNNPYGIANTLAYENRMPADDWAPGWIDAEIFEIQNHVNATRR